MYIFCNDEGILHKVDPRCAASNVVEAVSRSQQLVTGVVHHSWRQGVETHKVRYLTIPLET
jgi:hypothetical protein